MYDLSKNLVVLDCEVYPNYFLAAFKNLSSDKVLTVEAQGRESCLDETNAKNLKFAMLNRVTFGFNSLNYDLPIIYYALMGATCGQIYQLSKSIIDNSFRGWQAINHFNLKELRVKHFDIQEVAVGVKTSLKLYGARLNAQTLQDLPIDPHQELTNNDIINIKSYCINDLNTTVLLYENVKEQVALRAEMSIKYGINLLSKSDAQVAEAVFKTRLNKQSIKPPQYTQKHFFKYNKPDFITFKTQTLKALLNVILNEKFMINEKGSLINPKSLSSFKLEIGNIKYKIGVGGLHSQEKKRIVKIQNDEFLIDKDVVSYYPSIIINQELFPTQLGKRFIVEYKNIVQERIKAKKESNKIVNESFKILINGSFGKFSNRYSALYSPQLFLQTVITGQLSLLMLIEKLELHNIPVVSANTDGIVAHLKKTDYPLFNLICSEWQKQTGFILDETHYRALYSRDVNNYIAITTDNKTKTKGIFANATISKNMQMPIVNEAVIRHLIDSSPIEKTITQSKQIKEFFTVRTVTGGAVYKNQYLGRVVRWVYVKNGDQISYKKNGNKVAKSDGSMPVMELPHELPDNLDYDRYIAEAYKALSSLGIS